MSWLRLLPPTLTSMSSNLIFCNFLAPFLFTRHSKHSTLAALYARTHVLCCPFALPSDTQHHKPWAACCVCFGSLLYWQNFYFPELTFFFASPNTARITRNACFYALHEKLIKRTNNENVLSIPTLRRKFINLAKNGCGEKPSAWCRLVKTKKNRWPHKLDARRMDF